MATKVMPFCIQMPPLRVDGFAFYPYDPALENYLRMRSRFGEEVSLSIQTDGGRFLAVPRAICPEPETDRDYRTPGIKIDVQMRDSFQPRENQLDIIPQIHYLVKNGESFILQAGTGIGKTVLSTIIIAGHGVTTLVVVDQDNIRRQWRDAILRNTTIVESEIGYIQGDTCDVTGKKVVIAMLQSIHKRGRYPAWIYRHFGLVLFDECHILGATEFSKVCGLFPAKIRVGLSATPKRQDGLEKIFISHIGPIRIKKEGVPLKPKVMLINTGWQLPVVTRRDPQTGMPTYVKLPHTAGRLMEVYKRMANDDGRNRLIANLTLQCYNAGRNTVLFTDLKDEHHNQLEHWLVAAGIPLGDIGRYVGGLDEKGQDYASSRRVVLCTYKATAKAVDCPWWDTGIMVTPRADVAQICGRMLRAYDKKQCVSAFGTPAWNPDPACKVPVIFDLVDLDSNILQGYFKSRLSYYSDVGAVMAGSTELIGTVGYRKGALLYAPR